MWSMWCDGDIFEGNTAGYVYCAHMYNDIACVRCCLLGPYQHYSNRHTPQMTGLPYIPKLYIYWTASNGHIECVALVLGCFQNITLICLVNIHMMTFTRHNVPLKSWSVQKLIIECRCPFRIYARNRLVLYHQSLWNGKLATFRVMSTKCRHRRPDVHVCVTWIACSPSPHGIYFINLFGPPCLSCGCRVHWSPRHPQAQISDYLFIVTYTHNA